MARVKKFYTTLRGKRVAHAFEFKENWKKKSDAKKAAKKIRESGYPARVVKAPSHMIGYDVYWDRVYGKYGGRK